MSSKGPSHQEEKLPHLFPIHIKSDQVKLTRFFFSVFLWSQSHRKNGSNLESSESVHTKGLSTERTCHQRCTRKKKVIGVCFSGMDRRSKEAEESTSWQLYYMQPKHLATAEAKVEEEIEFRKGVSEAGFVSSQFTHRSQAA